MDRVLQVNWSVNFYHQPLLERGIINSFAEYVYADIVRYL